MRYIQRSNGMWLVDYTDEAGKRRRVSTGIKTVPARVPPPNSGVKARAQEIVLGIVLPKVDASLAPKQARKQDGRMTVSDLLDKCELTVWHPDNVTSQRTIRSNVKILRRFIGSEPVEEMTYARLEELVSEMKSFGYQPATIKRKLAMLGKALTMAVKWDLLRHRPPMPLIRVSNLKERIITPEEQEALFAAIEKRREEEPGRQWFAFRAFLTVVFDTGGRLSEVLGLGPKNIAEHGGVSRVTFPRYQTKSRKPRTLPLAPRAVEALGSMMDHLTRDKTTGEFRFFGFTAQTADTMFRQIRQDIGVDDIGIHTIRHTVLTRLARGGMDLARLQMWAGHSDPKITAMRYLHLDTSDLEVGLSILGTGGTAGVIKSLKRADPVSVPISLSVPNRAN